jgi:hypothetical protein
MRQSKLLPLALILLALVLLVAAFLFLSLIGLSTALHALSATLIVLALLTLVLIVLTLIAHDFLLGRGAYCDLIPAQSSRWDYSLDRTHLVPRSTQNDIHLSETRLTMSELRRSQSATKILWHASRFRGDPAEQDFEFGTKSKLSA